jgi:hypothetical protein
LVHGFLEKKLKNVWLPLYYSSEHRAKALYRSRTQMSDVVDDVMLLKNKNPKIKQYSVSTWQKLNK